jgi:hypothetical protein
MDMARSPAPSDGGVKLVVGDHSSPPRCRRTPILHQDRPDHDDAVLDQLTLGVPHPPAIAHQPRRGSGLDAAGSLEQIDGEARRHEVVEPVRLLKRAGDESDQRGTVQMILTPVALRDRRRKKPIGCDLGEVCRALGHSRIVA